jgi:hypothetical protein
VSQGFSVVSVHTIQSSSSQPWIQICDAEDDHRRTLPVRVRYYRHAGVNEPAQGSKGGLDAALQRAHDDEVHRPVFELSFDRGL